LTYVTPPAEVYVRLLSFELTLNQGLFVLIATLLLTLEFVLARHLFCRYGCSVGLFQSLAWMMNRDALVVGFSRQRAAACARCYDTAAVARQRGPGDAACEMACPMRLRPRVTKQQMFSCTQCGHCIDACQSVQETSLLHWVSYAAARRNDARMSLLHGGD
jgi:polyferredoxin